MPININNLTGTTGNSSKTRGSDEAAKSNTTGPQDKPGAQAASDKVQISAEAKVMKKLESEIKSLPDIDQNKINRIKDALRSGQYQIDYDRLATAISKFDSEL